MLTTVAFKSQNWLAMPVIYKMKMSFSQELSLKTCYHLAYYFGSGWTVLIYKEIQ